jgi:hypothetical protein
MGTHFREAMDTHGNPWAERGGGGCPNNCVCACIRACMRACVPVCVSLCFCFCFCFCFCVCACLECVLRGTHGYPTGVHRYPRGTHILTVCPLCARMLSDRSCSAHPLGPLCASCAPAGPSVVCPSCYTSLCVRMCVLRACGMCVCFCLCSCVCACMCVSE